VSPFAFTLVMIVVGAGFLALLVGLFLAMCMVARDAGETLRERAEREAVDPLERIYALPACGSRSHAVFQDGLGLPDRRGVR
jgi:hypothetical protein